MATTVRAVFDGEALRPEKPIDLRANARYVITIEGLADDPEAETNETYPLTEIARLATDMGVTDLSSRHGEYAHGRLPDA